MDFLSRIYTTDERDLVLYEIELFKRQDYQNIRDFVLNYLRDLTDINKFQLNLKNLEVLDLTLSFYPTNSVVEYVLDILKTLLEKQILLNISVDEKILGGAVFVYKGKYQNFSVLESLQNEGL